MATGGLEPGQSDLPQHVDNLHLEDARQAGQSPRRSKTKHQQNKAESTHPQDLEPSPDVNAIVERAWPLGTELYTNQRSKHWPKTGKHILAHYDDNSIIVYQAFCPEIAEAAVKDQKFGGGGYSFSRMSWIKTNFLWMMYRCGWATKPRQERVLAVRITLHGFNQILAGAYTVKLEKSKNLQKTDIEVRLQWDPDHDTSGEKEQRRTLQKYCTEWIVSITDITDFVRHQHRVLKQHGQWSVSMPRERVYTPTSPAVCQRIELDYFEMSEAQLAHSTKPYRELPGLDAETRDLHFSHLTSHISVDHGPDKNPPSPQLQGAPSSSKKHAVSGDVSNSSTLLEHIPGGQNVASVSSSSTPESSSAKTEIPDSVNTTRDQLRTKRAHTTAHKKPIDPKAKNISYQIPPASGAQTTPVQKRSSSKPTDAFLNVDGKPLNMTLLMQFFRDRARDREMMRQAQWAYLCLVLLVILMLGAMWCLGARCRYKPEKHRDFHDTDHMLSMKEILWRKRHYLPMAQDQDWVEVKVCDCGTNTGR
ncbi:hypothetical protein BaRGS_00027230 [Batillaria attramentaria]|uniref:Uncharacterized protein n=1 Tax=Batillaria attramentaria TaxID=370345 RepID=A0ABD0K2Q1_9CAEN